MLLSPRAPNTSQGDDTMKALRSFLALIIVCLLATTAFAKEKDGVTMPDDVQVGGVKLLLNGMGTREATMLKLDVYVAGLYLEAKSSDGAAIAHSTQKRRLVLRFVRDVDRSDIVDAWTKGFDNNGKDKGPLQSKIQQLNGWMASMANGQHLTFTYESGKGLEVNVNGQVKGTIAGDDFAEAFFLIWLGKNPPNEGLKSGLLGR